MIFSYIIVLTCIWWIVFYMALPFGNQITVKPENGHADSAPTKPRIGLKIIITSIISIILTFFIVNLIENHHLGKFIDKYITWLSGY
jgi:predicted secreted protein